MIVFGRALFAVLALGLFARLAGQAWRALGPAQWLRLALCGLLLAGHWVSFFIAVKTAGVAIATLGFASFPAFTVILEGLLFRERIHLAEGLLVVLVSLGLVLVTPNFDLASGATLGLLWAILSGLLFALLSLANRSNSGQVGPVQAALWQNLSRPVPAAIRGRRTTGATRSRLALAGPAGRLLHRPGAQPVRGQPGGGQGPHRGTGIRPGAGLRDRLRLAAVP